MFYDHGIVSKMNYCLIVIITLILQVYYVNTQLTKQKGAGEPCSNREFWSKVTLDKSIINSANAKLNQFMRPWNDSIYLEYIATGVRVNSDNMINSRQFFIRDLVLAECVTYSGVYLKKLEESLIELANQRSWAYSAHDTDLSYFNGRYFVDLMAAGMGKELGSVLYMLKDKLSKDTISNVTHALETRIIKPMNLSFNNDPWIKKKHGWETADNNWNPVCWAGVVLTALTVISDQSQRDFYVNKSFIHSQNYLRGFLSDGYYTEGAGYFNYGFSQYILMRQAVMEATDGKLDFFEVNPNLPKFSIFAFEFPMYGGIAALFGDDGSGEFSNGIRNYIQSTFSVDPTPNYNNSSIQAGSTPGFIDLSIYYNLLLDSKNRYPCSKRIEIQSGLRKYYDKSGILVARPGYGDGLHAAFKLLGGGVDPTGGHNHDDAGTYQILLKGKRVAGDVGGTTYSGPWGDRYNGFIYNSYSHPVPVIGGQLQTRNMIYNNPSNPIKPFVVSHSFTDDIDTITYDLKAAYSHPALRSLIRKNTYTRTPGFQSVIITDTVKYFSPTTFEVTLASRQGTWLTKTISSNQQTGTFTVSGVSVNVQVTSTSNFTLKIENLEANGLLYTRLGVVLTHPSLEETVSVIYT